MRTENESLEKSTELGMGEGRKGRVRPCMRWMDGVKASTKLSGRASERSAGLGCLEECDQECHQKSGTT